MTIKYNPNGGYKGTGGWYSDKEVVVARKITSLAEVLIITIFFIIPVLVLI